MTYLNETLINHPRWGKAGQFPDACSHIDVKSTSSDLTTKQKHIFRCFVFKSYNSLNFFNTGEPTMVGKCGPWECTKSLRQQVTTYVFSIALREPQQRQNHFPVTTLWKTAPSTQGMTLDKERIHPTLPHTRVAPEDGAGPRINLGGDGPSFLPCLWMPVEAEAPSANSCLWENRPQSQPPASTNGEKRCPFSAHGQNEPVQQLAAKRLQPHGTGKECKGLLQSWPPEWSFWAVWINGGWPYNTKEEQG